MEWVLEVLEVGLSAAALVVVLRHVRRRHRRLRARRPAVDYDATHPLVPTDDEHVCACGRPMEHDVHHRQGGVG